MLTIKIISLLLVLITTLLAGAYPFIKKMNTHEEVSFPIAESIAAGVFLGAGLMHMLGDASQGFYAQSYHYPFAFLLAGLMFLFLLLLEHIGREVVAHQGPGSGTFALLATLMLAIHSFLMGAALGLSETLSVTILILGAILAHKWAESFSLAIQINKSPFRHSTNILLFLCFAAMTPLGILSGASAHSYLNSFPLLEPVFSSLAAGTFLYLGTLHGLEQATLIKQCCDLNRYYFVMLGFAVMALVAVWT